MSEPKILPQNTLAYRPKPSKELEGYLFVERINTTSTKTYRTWQCIEKRWVDVSTPTTNGLLRFANIR